MEPYAFKIDSLNAFKIDSLTKAEKRRLEPFCTAALRPKATKQNVLIYVHKFEEILGFTPVEIVSTHEIYIKVFDILNTTTEQEVATRKHRICGARKKNLPDLRCLYPPGRKTKHKGYSRCNKHIIHEDVLALLAGMKKEGLAIPILELLQDNPELLQEERLNDLRKEIVITDYLLNFTLEKVHPELTVKILELQQKNKVAKAKIEKERLQISPSALRFIMLGFCEILRTELNPEDYARCIYRIEKDLAIPGRLAILPPAEDSNDISTILESEVEGDKEE
jgi:hypothetical protein